MILIVNSFLLSFIYETILVDMTTSKVGAVPSHGDHGASSYLATCATVLNAEHFAHAARKLGFNATNLMLHKSINLHTACGGTWVVDDPLSVNRDTVMAWQIARKINSKKKWNKGNHGFCTFEQFFGNNCNVAVRSQAIGFLVTHEFHPENITFGNVNTEPRERWIAQLSTAMSSLHVWCPENSKDGWSPWITSRQNESDDKGKDCTR